MSQNSSNTSRGSWLGDDRWSNYLQVTSPESSEALAKIGDIINADLLLPTWFKHIIVAATAAIKSQSQDCTQWIRSALNAGATTDNIFSAAITLVLSRGIFPARMLIESLIQVSPKLEMTASLTPSKDGLSPSQPTIEQYFISIFNQVPERVSLLIDECLPAMQTYHMLRNAGMDNTGLTPLQSELLLVAVNAADYKSDYVQVHAKGARTKGATDGHLVEACVCVIPFAGVAAWLPASEGLMGSRI